MKAITEEYLMKRIVIPSLKLDFDIFAEKKDQEQFNLFWNLVFSAWVQNAPKGTELRVYDFIGKLYGKKEKL